MNETVINKLRLDLAPLPARMQKLPIDARGYPVPWFVPMVDDKPEFRCMDPRKFLLAVRAGLCWVCGDWLGSHKSFVTGPMCLVSGTNSEPPSHWACATWSAKNCPFLSKPQMVRRENDLPEGITDGAGVPILRNPGVVAVSTGRNFQVFFDAAGKPLIRMPAIDDIEHVEWYRLGREATRAEVQESVRTGLEILMPIAHQDGEEAAADLKQRLVEFEKLLPKE